MYWCGYNVSVAAWAGLIVLTRLDAETGKTMTVTTARLCLAPGFAMELLIYLVIFLIARQRELRRSAQQA